MGDSEPKESEKDQTETASAIPLLSSSNATDQTPRPTPRKLPKFPIDLNMPMMVYWPEDDNKIIRSLREYEYGGPLPPQTSNSSASSLAASVDGGESSKKDILIPGVRVLSEYNESTPENFAMPTYKYLQYSTPAWLDADIHFDRLRVEYGVDDADLRWLEEQRYPEAQFDEEAMELLMDILEKESFRQLEFRQINAQVAQIDTDEGPDDDDQACAACGAKYCDDDNLILFCDGCDLPVHQQCQDLQHIPDGDWFCDTCVYRMVPNNANNSRTSKSSSQKSHAHSQRSKNVSIDFSIPVPCVLCGMVDGGIFKKTNIPGRFVHIACALMTPEVWFENDYANVSRALAVRKNVECNVCGYAGGTVKCHHRTCNTHYHVTCARENGQRLYFHLPDPEEEEELLMNLESLPWTAKNEILTALGMTDSIKSGQPESMDGEPMNGHSKMDESVSEDVDIVSVHGDLESAGGSHSNGKKSSGANKSDKPKKRKKRKAPTKKKVHQPFQSLCALHSGALKLEKLEEARKASLAIPVDVGRFLKEEEFEPSDPDCGLGDTTTFSKAVSILSKYHSRNITLQRDIFVAVVDYWKQKRLSTRLGHMPFIFQLHVLVTHFKENFDAGRKLESRPRQVELTLAQYSNEKKFQILKQLRDGVESLRTLVDLIKTREVKKKQAVVQRLELFDALMKQENPANAVRSIFMPTAAEPHPNVFSFGVPPLTIRIPVSQIRRSHATSSKPITAPPLKKVSPILPPSDDLGTYMKMDEINTNPPVTTLSSYSNANIVPNHISSLPNSTSFSTVSPSVASSATLHTLPVPFGMHQPELSVNVAPPAPNSTMMDVDPPAPSPPTTTNQSDVSVADSGEFSSVAQFGTETKEISDDSGLSKLTTPKSLEKEENVMLIAAPTARAATPPATSFSPKRAITDYFRPIPPKSPSPAIPASIPSSRSPFSAPVIELVD